MSSEGSIILGQGPSKEALAEVRETVMAIVTAPCGDSVKEKALEVIKEVAKTPQEFDISYCNFTMNSPTENHTHIEAPRQTEESDD